jgi:hypothetical protein
MTTVLTYALGTTCTYVLLVQYASIGFFVRSIGLEEYTVL